MKIQCWSHRGEVKESKQEFSFLRTSYNMKRGAMDF